jgi:hypothetical protein
MTVKKESRRVWAKECGTGCDGSVCVGGIERGRGVPSRKRKPAMTSSEPADVFKHGAAIRRWPGLRTQQERTNKDCHGDEEGCWEFPAHSA